MKSPSVALLVLNYNGMHYLKDCLDSVLATDYPNFEVVVIDNASTDNSVEFIKKNYQQVKLVECEQNYGFATALNLVLNSIKSEYVAFLNNDIKVEQDWLRKLLAYMENNGKVAAASPKMLFLQDKKRINAAGGNCDIYGVGWNRGNGEIDTGQYNKAQEVFYANGAALLIKKRAWLDVGAFDERYFLYGEDLDWCWRAGLKGYKVLYVPEAKIYHYWRGSKGKMIHFLEKHWIANLLKNYGLETLILITPKYLALKMLKAIWLLKNGKTINERLAVLTALVWNLKNLRGTWKKRVTIQSSRKISDKEIQSNMNKESFELQLWLKRTEHPLTEQHFM